MFVIVNRIYIMPIIIKTKERVLNWLHKIKLKRNYPAYMRNKDASIAFKVIIVILPVIPGFRVQ
jgi:hypothetical protein